MKANWLTFVERFVGFVACIVLLCAIRSISFRKLFFSHISHAFVPFSAGCLPPSTCLGTYVGEVHMEFGDSTWFLLRWLKICIWQMRTISNQFLSWSKKISTVELWWVCICRSSKNSMWNASEQNWHWNCLEWLAKCCSMSDCVLNVAWHTRHLNI